MKGLPKSMSEGGWVPPLALWATPSGTGSTQPPSDTTPPSASRLRHPGLASSVGSPPPAATLDLK